MWNWEWFSGWTGSHLHKPTTSHPHLKPALEPLCSLFPADQWDPDKTPATKETGFLGNFSRLVEKKIKRRAFTADLFREQKGSFRSVWEEGWARRKEWKKEKKSGRDERKKKEWRCLVFAPVLGFISFSRRASSTIYLVRKRHRERNARLSALSGTGAASKPQHRGIMGNHRRELPEVDPIIREALRPSRTHILHILRAQSPTTAVWVRRRVTCQRGPNFKVAFSFSFTTNSGTPPLPESRVHFKRDSWCKWEGVERTGTGEELRNKVLEGAHRREGGMEGGTTTFLLQGEKRQHSVGEEERVDSNWITGQKQKKDKKSKWQKWAYSTYTWTKQYLTWGGGTWGADDKNPSWMVYSRGDET